jgi:hypothetical protein
MSKAHYKVTGIHPVMGNQPGSVFIADLTEEMEQALVTGGALEKQPDPVPDPKITTTVGTPDSDLSSELLEATVPAKSTSKAKPTARDMDGEDAGSWRPR